MNAIVSSPSRRLPRRALALAALLSLLPSGLPAAAQSAAPKTAPALTEEQRIVHVLNRLGFGPRPGDVERVRRLGVEKYIEQQLNPSSVDDAAVEAVLKRFPTLAMSNTELLAKYPNSGQLVRRLRRRGELPAELAEVAGLRGQRPPARRAVEPEPQADSPQTDAPAMSEADAPDANEDNRERAEYRRRLRAYMRGQGFEPPQRILQELQSARLLRAVYSERQLQEVLVDFWTNHFNVFAGKGAGRWFLTSFDRDVIRPHALGNFRDLLEATAQSPAMLFYLDNFQSADPNARQWRRGALRRTFGADADDPNSRRAERRAMRRRQREEGAATAGGQSGAPRRPRPRTRRGINENYARELMELHTLGVEGGYTQKDVQEVARAFTGWTIVDPRGALGTDRGGTFVFNPRMHDDGEKTVLGHKIPAGGGVEDGRRVLDILAGHPSTARFISTKLARRFVSDSPRPETVARAAEAFTRSRGDIRATLGALFASPEFNSAEARRAKIKTPFELAASALRALGAETGAGPALHRWVARMGEPLYLYQAPTGYPETAGHWVNTGALLERLNFALALASNRIPGTRVELSRFAREAGADRPRLVEQLLAHVLRGEVSPRSREVLLKQLAEQKPAAGSDSEVARVAALVIGSPEFQRQ
ncbi:MAG TPA: DUF1800 domain-containing protein [Pyrinomonadaceae bacterium]|nr:DUF1800 domain-containing protein [Pyrinomonadaceae bacterium]